MDEQRLQSIEREVASLRAFVTELRGVSLDPRFDSNLADKYLKKGAAGDFMERFTVGTGLSLDDGTLLVTGILKVIAGTGISLSPSGGTGDVTITNTVTAGSLKLSGGNDSYGVAHNNTTPHITTTDGSNFQPRAVFVFASQTGVTRTSSGFYGPGIQAAITSGTNGINGNVAHFTSTTNLNISSTDSSGFTWTVKVADAGSAFSVFWLAVGFA